MPAVAFKEGVVAAKVGDDEGINPHTPGSDKHAAWSTGYVAAENALKADLFEPALTSFNEADPA
ncbi:hypothetical protein P7D22_13300 [Lichenihabitans sp. Uapishka_5]|uniref:hypothetical protein n=1 Tax=Lichenihabitans sp. Uapishka_5 TaxID=3037302 RepID=UPI0029E7F7CD|nr:hypothetical protein [Lichenihabitans sp. Uapishka_5]MDX7952151.1 hypothetical protein [Lichenihabitans sp. Uapishka_5]